MTEVQDAVVTGPGFAAGSLDGMGEGPGFRKVRAALDVKEFGINAIVMPPGIGSGRHWHDQQEELYFVHQGTLKLHFGLEGEDSVVLGPGGMARVDAATVRRVSNVGEDEAIYVVIGAKDGYIGRDGQSPDDEPRIMVNE